MGNDRPGENVVLNKTVVDSDWLFNSNKSLIPSADVPLVQLTLTLNMTGAQAVQMSDTVNNSPIHDYSHLVHHNYSTYSVVFCYLLFLLCHFFKQILCFCCFCFFLAQFVLVICNFSSGTSLLPSPISNLNAFHYTSNHRFCL